MDMVSQYFSVEETVVSKTAEEMGLSNVPSELVAKTILTCASYMDTIREALGTPIIINSWYRSPPLCIAIGSKSTSQHTKGEAVDWTSPAFGTPAQIASFLATKKVIFGIDQLILEHTWIHTSFAIAPPRKPRGQILSLLASGGYAVGLTDQYGKLLA